MNEEALAEELRREKDRLLMQGIAWGAGSIQPPDTMTAAILENADWFKRSPEARLRMQLARAAGISYPDALGRWGTAEAIAYEMAYNLVLADENLELCPDCGTHPDDMVDEKGRPLDEPKWKFVVHDCLICEHVAEANEGLQKQKTRKHRRVRVMPRNPGESMIPEEPDDD